MKSKLPELIAPAGDWSALRSAVAAGCDGVYFGIKGLNMRQGAANFQLLEMKKIVDYLHKNNKKAYLALNVIVYNDELDKVERILKQAKQSKVDSVILWDMAVLRLAKKHKLKIHLSTQASISNIEALKFFYQQGAERVVLARECTLKDIKKISSAIKKSRLSCSIEAFVHGAMCVSLSGRCFLSQETFGKSANRGECLQPCRRAFRITDVDKQSEYILGNQYLLSPKDLCTISILDKLIESGIDAFKIEGRNRSPEYVSVVTAAYRKAIDAYAINKLTPYLKSKLINEVKTVYNRGFDKGFYLGGPGKLGGVVEKSHIKEYIGEVTKYYKKINVAEILIRKGPLSVGDQILITGKNTPANFMQVKELQVEHNQVMEVLKGKRCGIKVEFKVNPKDKVFLYKVIS